MHHDRKGDVLRVANISPKLRLHHSFYSVYCRFICFKRKLIKDMLIAFYFDFAMNTQDIALAVLMTLACANCSRPVTSANLRRLDGIASI